MIFVKIRALFIGSRCKTIIWIKCFIISYLYRIFTSPFYGICAYKCFM